VVVTGQPKAGQDPNNPADRATKARSAKVPPKSGRCVPARAVFSGRSVPVEIVNGLSGDEASFASRDEFASKEEDNKRNPDKDIATAAQFALGVAPSDEAWAAATRLPGAIVVRRALAALRDDTNEEASLAAASDSKAAAQATLRNGGEPNKEAKFGANRQAKREGHMRKEAGRATKRKSHHPGGPIPQVLMADEDANVAANWQAKEGGHPSGEASWATKRKANHAAHQGGRTCSPQGSTALFGPTVGKNQGRTRQRGSAANVLPAPRKVGDAEAWLQAKRGHKEAAHAAAQRKTNHSATQGGGTCSPQVLAVLFGSTVGKFQGETGQHGSAAIFLPAPKKGGSAAGFLPATGTPYKKEAAIAQGARGPRHRWSLAASTKDEDPPNNTGMAKLGQNMSVPGTTAA
jgi:hypothetical protein